MRRERAAWKKVEALLTSGAEYYICVAITRVTTLPWFWFLSRKMYHKVGTLAPVRGYPGPWLFPLGTPETESRQIKIDWIKERIKELS